MVEGVRIVKVSRNQVDFEWHTSDVNAIFPAWRANARDMGNGGYTIGQRNGVVAVNPNSNKVYFSLHPNQTFTGRTLYIDEGRASDLTREAVAAVNSNN